MRYFDDEEEPIINFPGIPAKAVHANAFAGAKLSRWDRESDLLEPVPPEFEYVLKMT